MKTLKRAPGAASSLVLQEGKGWHLGLDLGQSQDYSALCVLERVVDFEDRRTPYKHYIRFAKRYHLGTPYPDVVSDVMHAYVSSDELRVEEEARPSGMGFRETPLLVVDATGVGAAVRDEFKKHHRMSSPDLKAVIITGGLEEHYEKGAYRVPKSRLLEQFQVDAQFGMLKIASGIELLDTLKAELANIRPKIRPDSKALTYEEIREAVHDDLVLASSLAHWAARKFARTMRVLPKPPGW